MRNQHSDRQQRPVRRVVKSFGLKKECYASRSIFVSESLAESEEFGTFSTLGHGGRSASWKVRRPLETKTFVFLPSPGRDSRRESRRGSLDNVVVAKSHSSSSSSWSNLPPEIFIRLLKITSMVIAYIFDMQSPGITKHSLLEAYRQACNMAIIAVSPPVSMSRRTSLTIKI